MLRSLWVVFSPGAIEGWWIPTYLAEKHPELTTIEGIMANPELVGGRFNNCPDGWGCRVANDNLVRALDLEAAGIDVFNHGSGETLASSMASAVQKQEPWFGYYWGPTVPLGKFDMTRVKLGEYKAEVHAKNQSPDADNPKVSEFPAATVLTTVTPDFEDREPEVAEMLAQLSFETETMSSLLAWMDANNATAEEAAVYYLSNYGDDVLALGEDGLRALRRQKMSMVFQKFALLPHKTVLENAGMSWEISGQGREAYEEEARKWLARVGLEGSEEQHPHQLSGGMQQRVGIARALVSNSPVMLMDEAFSALDPLIRSDMQDLLLELQAELHKTIVFITHDLDEALKLAGHLVILKDGEVVQQGDPQGILLHPNDPYIVDFISDINRARVLRVRSVMGPVNDAESFSGDVLETDNLEAVLAKSGGDVSQVFRVVRDGQPVGSLAMTELTKALVPTEGSGARMS